MDYQAHRPPLEVTDIEQAFRRMVIADILDWHGCRNLAEATAGALDDIECFLRARIARRKGAA